MLQGKTAGTETIWPVLSIALVYFAHTPKQLNPLPPLFMNEQLLKTA